MWLQGKLCLWYFRLCVCAHQFQNEHPDFQSYDSNCWCFSYICAKWDGTGMDRDCLHLHFNYDSVEWYRKSHCSPCKVGVVGFVVLPQTMLTVALPAYKIFLKTSAGLLDGLLSFLCVGWMQHWNKQMKRLLKEELGVEPRHGIFSSFWRPGRPVQPAHCHYLVTRRTQHNFEKSDLHVTANIKIDYNWTKSGRSKILLILDWRVEKTILVLMHSE